MPDLYGRDAWETGPEDTTSPDYENAVIGDCGCEGNGIRVGAGSFGYTYAPCSCDAGQEIAPEFDGEYGPW